MKKQWLPLRPVQDVAQRTSPDLYKHAEVKGGYVGNSICRALHPMVIFATATRSKWSKESSIAGLHGGKSQRRHGAKTEL